MIAWLFFSLIVSLITYIILTRINLLEVFGIILKADLGLFLGVLFLSLVTNVLLSALRWKMVLRALGYALRYKDILYILLVSLPALGIGPFKSGILVRAAYLSKEKKIPYDIALFSCFLPAIFNGVSLFLIFVSSFLADSNINHSFYFTFFSWKDFSKKSILFFNKNIDMPQTFDSLFQNGIRVFLDWKIHICTIFLWIIKLMSFYLLAISLSCFIPLISIFKFYPLVIFFSHIPLPTGGGLALRSLLILNFFAPYASENILLSISLLYIFVENIFPDLTGVIFVGHWVKEKISIKDRILS